MILLLLFLLGGAIGATIGMGIGLAQDRREQIRIVGWRALRPASHCNHCRRPLRPGQTIPVLSWLLLDGRAACCGERIPARLLALEVGGFLAGGTLFLAILVLA